MGQGIPHLPDELMDMIIGMVYRKATLCSLAQSSQRMYDLVMSHLYTEIRLYGPTDEHSHLIQQNIQNRNLSPAEVRDLISMLTSKPQLRGAVRKLALATFSPTIPLYSCADGDASLLLSLLTDLRSLTLDAKMGFQNYPLILSQLRSMALSKQPSSLAFGSLVEIGLTADNPGDYDRGTPSAEIVDLLGICISMPLLRKLCVSLLLLRRSSDERLIALGSQTSGVRHIEFRDCDIHPEDIEHVLRICKHLKCFILDHWSASSDIEQADYRADAICNALQPHKSTLDTLWLIPFTPQLFNTQHFNAIRATLAQRSCIAAAQSIHSFGQLTHLRMAVSLVGEGNPIGLPVSIKALHFTISCWETFFVRLVSLLHHKSTSTPQLKEIGFNDLNTRVGFFFPQLEPMINTQQMEHITGLADSAGVILKLHSMRCNSVGSYPYLGCAGPYIMRHLSRPTKSFALPRPDGPKEVDGKALFSSGVERDWLATYPLLNPFY